MAELRMTTLGHSCVRLEHGGTTVVIDPGIFSDQKKAYDGAHAVLITHEHVDHVVPEELRSAAEAAPDLEIWTNPALAGQLSDLGGRVHAVTHGDTFTVGDLDVHVYGAKHAVIYRDIPVIDNVGFMVGGRIFHPGDALTVPEEKVPTLLSPGGAPWAKISELIDYVREVAPDQAYLIHTAVLSEAGQGIAARLLTEMAGNPYDRSINTWQSGDSVVLN